MTTPMVKTSPQITTRLAGFLYLLVVPLGIFGLVVSSTLIVSGDPAATARNVMASERLFRLGIVSDMLAAIAMLLVALVLYPLLKSVNRNLALLMVAFLLVGVPISLLNKVNQFAYLQLLSGSDYITGFTTEQLQTLAFVFLRLHSRGANIAFLFWGLWLLPLGWLVFKSGFLPKILGVLLIISCFGYLIDNFAVLLGYSVNIGMVSAAGELSFIFWLLIKGVDVEQWNKRALESA